MNACVSAQELQGLADAQMHAISDGLDQHRRPRRRRLNAATRAGLECVPTSEAANFARTDAQIISAVSERPVGRRQPTAQIAGTCQLRVIHFPEVSRESCRSFCVLAGPDWLTNRFS
jgi:hypothetical protein